MIKSYSFTDKRLGKNIIFCVYFYENIVKILVFVSQLFNFPQF